MSFAERADEWLATPILDLVPPVVLTGLHFLVALFWPPLWSLGDVPPGQRALIYGALATVAALAAGSNNTAVGSYVSSSGSAMDRLRTSHGGTMRSALRSVGISMWVVATAALLCLALDPLDRKNPNSAWGAEWLAEFCLLVLVVNYARLTFLQDLILGANDLSAQREKADSERTVLTRRQQKI